MNFSRVNLFALAYFIAFAPSRGGYCFPRRSTLIYSLSSGVFAQMLEARREIKLRLYIVNTIFFRISEQKEWKELRRRTLRFPRLPGFHRTSRNTLSASGVPLPPLAATALQINTKIKKMPPRGCGKWMMVHRKRVPWILCEMRMNEQRVERETENFSEGNKKSVRREKFFSGNRFKKIYHTKIYSPSAHHGKHAKNIE